MPRVALVQFAPLSPSPLSHNPDSSASWQLNLERAHDFARQAALQGAELVCFPEYFLSGVVDHPSSWHLAQAPHTHAHLHAPSSPSPSSAEEKRCKDAPAAPLKTADHWLSTFRDLAKELRVDIAVGTIVERAVDAETGEERSKDVEVEGEGEGGTRVEKRPVLENVAHYIDWNGEVVGRYSKVNLWWPEKEYLTAGTGGHQVFSTRFGRVAFLICWDLASPLSLPSLLLDPAGPPDMIIAPTYWTALDAGARGLAHNPRSEEEYLGALVKTRAWEGECAVLFVNAGAPASWQPHDPVGNEEGRIGGTGAYVPFKGCIGGAKGAQEELVLVDVDLSILSDARAVYGVRRDLAHKLDDPQTRREEVLPGWVRRVEGEAK
ncbi:hypothetical protein JCM10207_005594 [Rhodosporidiobolus poonsookiae]